MSLVPTSTDPLQRGVSVRIGHAQPATVRRGKPGLCIVGLCPGGSPWLADRLPDAIVRDTRYRTDEAAVEHVRVRSRDDLKALPGLGDVAPSRIRDAVVLGLTAGAPEVDVVLARCGDCQPWDLDRPEVSELIAPFLAELPGAVVAYPDIAGPATTQPGQPTQDWETRTRIVNAVRHLAPGLVQRYQVGLLDDAGLEYSVADDLRRSLVGTDVAICGWSGAEHRLRAHGWRSAAAVIGGLLASDGEEVGRGLVGRTAVLPPGRSFARNRTPDLSLEDRAFAGEADDHVIRLRLHGRRENAQVTCEPTFRQPVGEWSVAALRAVKVVHRQLIHAAQAFVFRNATDTQAAALGGALQRALRPFMNRGMLVGGTDGGPPRIKGGVDAIPGEPGLHAMVTAQLRPWSHRVVVRVAVRPGQQPTLEVQ